MRGRRRRPRAGGDRAAPNIELMEPPSRGIPDLELALLRRGVDERIAGSERCGRCKRSPLIGERLFFYEDDAVLCELCQMLHPEASLETRLVHGPQFGHTIRILDRRAA